MFLNCARPWIALCFFAASCAVTVAEETASRIANQAAHPLSPIIRYATSHSGYIRENVRDYSCRIIKRERIDGKLQEQQFANLTVRCEQQHADGSVQPLAVFMQFLAPRTIKDRRVLYIADQNDGKVLVRKGGKLLNHMKLRVNPLSARARSESKYTIMDAGLDKLMDRFVQQSEDDRARDQAAANTRVSHFANAMINERPCTHIQIVHPEQTGGMEFHSASLYVDNELHVPTRLVVHGWPEREGDEPPVNEEYTYLDLRLNVGLTDSDFSETLLENSRTASGDRSETIAIGSGDILVQAVVRIGCHREHRGEMTDELTEKIIGAAIEVHRVLGPGLLESIYEEALCYELGLRGVECQRQVDVDVIYKERVTTEQRADVLVEGEIVVELKADRGLPDVATAQTLSYLKATRLKRAY